MLGQLLLVSDGLGISGAQGATPTAGAEVVMPWGGTGWGSGDDRVLLLPEDDVAHRHEPGCDLQADRLGMLVIAGEHPVEDAALGRNGDRESAAEGDLHELRDRDAVPCGFEHVAVGLAFEDELQVIERSVDFTVEACANEGSDQLVKGGGFEFARVLGEVVYFHAKPEEDPGCAGCVRGCPYGRCEGRYF